MDSSNPFQCTLIPSTPLPHPCPTLPFSPCPVLLPPTPHLLPQHHRITGGRRRAQVLKLNHFKFKLNYSLPAPLQKRPSFSSSTAFLATFPTPPCPLSAVPTPFQPAASCGGEEAGHGAQEKGAQIGQREHREAMGGTGGMAAEGSGEAVKSVALHLRYEPDMLAFTGCDYGGGRKERSLFEGIRKRPGSVKIISPPPCLPLLVPQVAVALQTLGFPPSTRLYIASGELHGGPSALRPLLKAFPLATDKYSLAHSLAHAGGKEGRVADRDGSRGEVGESGAAESVAAEWRREGDGGGGVGRGVLEGLQGRKTLLAAMDYEMCRRGHMLVLNNNGNMAHLLSGHRRYNGMGSMVQLYDGVGNTVQLFGSSILRLLTAIQQGDAKSTHKLRNQTLRGDDSNGKAAVRGSFYSFPWECLCERSDHVSAGIYS
ncbi:unnamed protein product [Closterium sp. Naga37s-1]|nr:unnamed protein product [Closterium sp. Naga37s-1]